MTVNVKLRNLLVIALVGGLSSVVTAYAEENDTPAPEATAAEAELSFRDIPYLEKAFIDTAPADRNDGIVVDELGVNGSNKDMIVELAQEIADNKHGRFDSLLIAHKGKLVFESYYLRGRVDLPHPQASATKVYTSMAIGRAIQLGYLTMADLNKPLVSFLDDLDPEKFVDGAELITLHQAMTMSSGIRINEDTLRELRGNPGPLVRETSGPLKGQGQVQAILEHSAPISEESQSFHYQFIDADLVMQVLDAVVPGTAEDFIKNELLDKMGIENYDWWTDPSGLPRASGGSSMTSRDMLKWGILATNRGKWNGEQLISSAFMFRSTLKFVQDADDENFLDHGNVRDTGYGYFWWQSHLSTGDKRYFSASARGGGGQFVIAVNHLDLVIVVTAHDRDFDTLSLAGEQILPAFVQAVDASTEDRNSRTPEATIAELEGSFRDIPFFENAFVDPAPADREDGIPVGELSADGGTRDMLVKLAEDIDAGQYGEFDSLLIAHNDKLVFESYYSRGRVDLPHPQASATKTYTAMALGRAIQLGFLTMADLDKPLISFFDALDPDQFVEGAELITLHNALTMTTGIRIPEEQLADFRQNPEQIEGRKQVQALLEHSAAITTESQSFLYGGDGPDLVMQVIDAVAPGSAKDFIEDELLEKMGISFDRLDQMGITYYDWRTAPSGLPDSGSAATMRSRDMVKWGMLIAGNGKWNGQQLVPEAFIDRATSMVIDTGDDDIFGGGPNVFNQGYGYFMWNADLRHGDKTYYSASAQGGAGQFIILIEELDLVVVATANEPAPSTLQMTAERILPAFVE